VRAPYSDDDLAALRRYLDNPAHAFGQSLVEALTVPNARAIAVLWRVEHPREFLTPSGDSIMRGPWGAPDGPL
jgi:hypothetical protein